MRAGSNRHFSESWNLFALSGGRKEGFQLSLE
jgi:hypothetical protein